MEEWVRLASHSVSLPRFAGRAVLTGENLTHYHDFWAVKTASRKRVQFHMTLSQRSRLAFALAAVAVGLHEVPGHGQSRVSAEPPRAVVHEVGHDFGPVTRGGRLAHTFTIGNSGTGPLNILSVDYSQPGMRSRFKSVVLPKEAGEITIEWDTAHASGDLDAQAVVHLNDPKRPRVTFTLTGVVGQSIAIQPSPDVFFTVFEDQTAERHVTIVSNEDRPLAIKGLKPAGEHFRAAVSEVQPGKRYDILVSVPRGLTPGRYYETLDVETDHPRLGPVRIGVNVFVKHNLYASPEVVDFGDVSLQQIRAGTGASLLTRSSTLTKRAGMFAITSITSDVPALRIGRSPSGDSNSFGLNVTIDDTRVRAGSLEGTIEIKTDDKDFPHIVIPVHGHVR